MTTAPPCKRCISKCCVCRRAPAVMPPLIEPLSSALCRVNLQPFVHNRGSVERLWRQFRHTAQTYASGTLVDLERDWRQFRSSSWAQRYAPEVLDQFWQRMATAGFTAVHHSRGLCRSQCTALSRGAAGRHPLPLCGNARKFLGMTKMFQSCGCVILTDQTSHQRE